MTITGRTGERVADAPLRRVRRPSIGHWADVVTAIGLLVVVAGTFLPWLHSGAAERNSYSADGVLRELLDLHGLSAAVLRCWPFLPLVSAVALGLLIIRLRRAGAILAGLGALAAGLVCIRVLLTHPSVIFRIATSGPALTVIGCAVSLVGVLAVLVVPLRAAPGGVAPSDRSGRIR